MKPETTEIVLACKVSSGCAPHCWLWTPHWQSCHQQAQPGIGKGVSKSKFWQGRTSPCMCRSLHPLLWWSRCVFPRAPGLQHPHTLSAASALSPGRGAEIVTYRVFKFSSFVISTNWKDAYSKPHYDPMTLSSPEISFSWVHVKSLD